MFFLEIFDWRAKGAVIQVTLKKMYMKGKPVREGLLIVVIASLMGIVHWTNAHGGASKKANAEVTLEEKGFW